MYNLKLVEKKGDVTFYEDSKGVMYQQLGKEEPFKVRNGKIAFIVIKQVNGYTIKYNTNGSYGYVIFQGKTALEDRIWSLEQAIEIAKEM